MSLELESLVVSFGKNEVIHNFSCKINENSTGVLLGKSGSGKSTILKTIAGIIIPRSGKVIIEGEDVTNNPSGSRRVGFVPQHQLLFPGLNVYENVAYGLKSRGKPREVIRKRIKEIEKTVGLQGLMDRKPSTLSGGERQRVALARALAPEPKILLMDEPFSSLDEAERIRLALVFKQIQQEVGITTVHVTHSSTEADLLADKVIVLEKGRVMQEGLFEEVLKHPKTFSIAQLLGLPNVFRDVPYSIRSIWKDLNRNSDFFYIPPESLYLEEGGVICKVVSMTQDATYFFVDGLFVKAQKFKNLKPGDKVRIGYRKIH